MKSVVALFLAKPLEKMGYQKPGLLPFEDRSKEGDLVWDIQSAFESP